MGGRRSTCGLRVSANAPKGVETIALRRLAKGRIKRLANTEQRVRQDTFVVIGSGPSLNKIPVEQLRAFQTIAFNRSYIAWKRWGFDPTYCAIFDPIVIEDNAAELANIVAQSSVHCFFFNETARNYGFSQGARLKFLRLSPRAPFSTDLISASDFGNVGASCLQILAALGARKIILLGIDGNYSLPRGAPSEREGLVRMREDPDHFCPEYAIGKLRAEKPDITAITQGWSQVARECASRGIEVRNASPGTAIKAFPCTTFEEAIDWSNK